MASRLIDRAVYDHAGHLSLGYREYLDSLALHHFDDRVRECKWYAKALHRIGHYSDATIEVIDDGNAIRSGCVAGAWDGARRLKAMDDDGIAAESRPPGVPDAIGNTHAPR